VLDAPILIRTADVDLDGRLCVTAGATLVRDSDPAYETAETHAKAAGVLTAFGLVAEPTKTDGDAGDLARDEDVLIALGRRNSRLSSFWLTDQSSERPVPELAGRTAVILDGEDAFVNMLRHVLGVLGMSSSVVRHEDWTPGALAGHDLVVVGPGPGDPREREHPKIATFRAAVDELLHSEQPFLAVCLGHQVLSDAIGLDLAYKDIVFQGTQNRLDVLGGEEVVGFYNTFVARTPADGAPDGVRVEVEPASGDVHLLAGPTYRGVQFHAESILTQHGHDLLRRLVLELLG
jgi:phenazine biosynthesis protein phzE